VDDNDIHRRVLRRMLETLGWDVDEAADGMLALEQATRRSYAAIFLDLRMPRMSGQDVALRLRSSQGPSARAQILAITADTLRGDPEACREAGMDAWLLKPVTVEDLQAALDGPLAPQGPLLGRRAEMAEAALQSLSLLVHDGDLLREVLGAFASSAQERMAWVRGAAIRGDLEQLAEAAHSFRGICGMVGATGLSRLLGQLEALAPGGGPEDILPVLAEANLELAAVLARIREQIGNLDRAR
jgi:CheY-like chemotaxis protein